MQGRPASRITMLMETFVGRSLRSCQMAFQALRAVGHGPSSALGLSAPQAISTDATSPNPRKRPISGPPGKDTPTPGGRTLQPRPPAFSSINGQTSSPYQASSPADDANQPPKKKRGRPSKAELELRSAAAAAKGEAFALPKPVKSTGTQELPGKMYSGQDSASPAVAANPFLASPEATASGTGEPGSVTKKRRGRPTKEEAQAKRLLLEAAAVAASGEGATTSAAPAPAAPAQPEAADMAVDATTAESSGTLQLSADAAAKDQ